MPKIEADLIDAPNDLDIYIFPRHLEKAVSKHEDVFCDPHGLRTVGCVGEIAWLEQYPQFAAVKIDATVARGRLEGKSPTTLRWVMERDGQFLTTLNDQGPEELLRTYTNWPIVLRLIAPTALVLDEDTGELVKRRETRSLEWGRSEEGRKKKRESAGTRTIERKGGAPKQSYKSPPVRAGRNGRIQKGWLVRG